MEVGMKIMVAEARAAKIGDIITVAVHNDNYDRGVHLIAKIVAVNPEPHPEIIEFRVKILAHCGGKGVGQEQDVGMRPERQIGIMRL